MLRPFQDLCSPFASEPDSRCPVTKPAFSLSIPGSGNQLSAMQNIGFRSRLCAPGFHPPGCFFARNSRGARPVAFRKARAKLAEEEYPNSAEISVTDPLVWCNSSVAR